MAVDIRQHLLDSADRVTESIKKEMWKACKRLQIKKAWRLYGALERAKWLRKDLEERL